MTTVRRDMHVGTRGPRRTAEVQGEVPGVPGAAGAVGAIVAMRRVCSEMRKLRAV